MNNSQPIGLIFLWGLYLLLFYLIYLVIKPFIYPILWAGILTIIFSPVYKKILSLTKYRETLSASITLAIIVLIVMIPGVMLLSLIIAEAIDFIKRIPTEMNIDFTRLYEMQFITNIFKNLENSLNINLTELKLNLFNKIKNLGYNIIVSVEKIFLDLPSDLINLFISLFTTFFLLRDGKTFGNLLKNLLPLSKTEIDYYFDKLKKVVYATFIGVLLTAVVQGFIAFISFYFIGIKSSLLLGLLVAISSLVPIVGSALVWVPLAIYLILTGLVLKGILVIIVGVLFISTVDNFVRPIFLHQYLSLHLLLTFFSLFGGIKAFGLIGIFLGPIIISAFIGCCMFYQDHKQQFENSKR
jgi:predicted PurR-regulated permease PerM